MLGGAGPPRPLSTGEITSISMDGPRVAIAVRDPSGRCDRVFIWNVPWHYLSRLSDAYGQTCLPNHAPGGITDVAMAGGRAAWTTTYGATTRIIAATGTACQEWVVARSSAGVAGLAGDGTILSYALRSRNASVGIVPKLWRGVDIDRSQPPGSGHLRGQWPCRGATGHWRRHDPDARWSVRRSHSRRGSSRNLPTAGHARRAHTARDARRLSDGVREADPLVESPGDRDVPRPPLRDRAADSRPRCYAVNVESGRAARLFRAPTRVSAELEGLGAVIQFNTARRGHVRFVPMSRIEARTR